MHALRHCLEPTLYEGGRTRDSSFQMRQPCTTHEARHNACNGTAASPLPVPYAAHAEARGRKFLPKFSGFAVRRSLSGPVVNHVEYQEAKTPSKQLCGESSRPGGDGGGGRAAVGTRLSQTQPPLAGLPIRQRTRLPEPAKAQQTAWQSRSATRCNHCPPSIEPVLPSKNLQLSRCLSTLSRTTLFISPTTEMDTLMSTPPRSRSSSSSSLTARRHSPNLSLDLDRLPALSQPSPPSNTLIITVSDLRLILRKTRLTAVLRT